MMKIEQVKNGKFCSVLYDSRTKVAQNATEAYFLEKGLHPKGKEKEALKVEKKGIKKVVMKAAKNCLKTVYSSSTNNNEITTK